MSSIHKSHILADNKAIYA